MDSHVIPLQQRQTFRHGLIAVATLAAALAVSSADAQIRSKKPDRGRYQPPMLPVTGESPRSEASVNPTQPSKSQPSSAPRHETDVSGEDAASIGPDAAMAEMIRRASRGEPIAPEQRRPVGDPRRHSSVSNEGRPLMSVAIEEARSTAGSLQTAGERSNSNGSLKQVGHEEIILVEPTAPRPQQSSVVKTIGQPIRLDEGSTWREGDMFGHDGTCDGCPDCDDGCDSLGCDSIGWGTGGSCDPGWYHSWSNSSICFNRDRWFGSAELLLMFGRGDRLPPLVTTVADGVTDPDPDLAGELGDADTVILVGNETEMKDLRVGGRLMIGTWLDSHQCRSLVARGWVMEEERFRFATNQDATPVIARPFLNVTDGQTEEQDTQLIAFPDRVDGGISVHATSDIVGGDISVRQLWYERFGGTIDLLYGYQYMRLDEDLRIASSSTSLSDDFAPVGTVLNIEDSFDAENEFHGGQFGVATYYHENCWSFQMLAKVGFGSLRRTAALSGSTLTRVGADETIDPNGLLVRSTNSGRFTDHTFGWVPELNLTWGWQRWKNMEATFGYSVIAMTDAVQVSGLIDNELASNLASPPTGQQRPRLGFRDKTFYVQGIHFGLHYFY